MLISFALLALAIVALPESQAAPVQSEANGHAKPSRCHTVTSEVYNKELRKLDRVTGYKHRRVKNKVCRSRFDAVRKRVKQICKPRHVVTGRTSVFDDSQTFTGLSASTHEGLAINIAPGTDHGWSNSQVRRWALNGTKFIVKLKGKQRVTRLIDLGPAGWVNRALDFSRPLANAMGFYNFPTDSVGSLWRLRRGCQ